MHRNLTRGFACWEDGENLFGVVNGSIRVSAGWCTRWEDIQKFKLFVTMHVKQIGRQTFVTTTSQLPTADVAIPPSASVANGVAPSTVPPLTPFSFKLPQSFHVAPAAKSAPTSSLVAAAPAAASRTTPLKQESSMVVSLVPALSPPPPALAGPYVLTALTVYPIKSCAGISVTNWWVYSAPTSAQDQDGTSAISSTLFLDREFVLLDAYGVALSQKLIPKLQLLRPQIDLRERTLTLHAPELTPMIIQLEEKQHTSEDSKQTPSSSSAQRLASLCSLEVCGASAVGYVYDDPVAHAALTTWLTSFVGKYTCLARKSQKLEWPAVQQCNNRCSSSTADVESPSPVGSPLLSSSPSPPSTPLVPLSATASATTMPNVSSSATTSAAAAARASFANENDYLLVNAASVRDITSRLQLYVASHPLHSLNPHPHDQHITPARFRPNFVIDSGAQTLLPWQEDEWKQVRVGDVTFACAGPCARCIMVNVDPGTGERASALYSVLHTFRKKESKIVFGTLLTTGVDKQEMKHDKWRSIAVGMAVSAV